MPLEYNRKYARVVFQFYYMEPKGKEIKAVALNINDVRLTTEPMHCNGLIEVYLSDKKTHKFFVDVEMFEPSRVFDIDIELRYNYSIDIYLSKSRKPLH